METILHLPVAVASYLLDIAHGLWAGAHLFMSWNNLLAVFGGVTIGCFFGALPGLSITLALALVMPFSYGMEPLTGLTLLSAVYVGAIYGGSISAILFNTPGTPAAACTTVDGYALTQKGMAGKALQMANVSSMVGDLTSTCLVILLFPLLAKVTIYFKSPEYFALICFAITIVGSVAGRSIVLGIIAGIMGFLLSTIGMDPVEGSGRFDFGSIELLSGVGFVPLLIGLFAIPEFVRQYRRSRMATGPITLADGGATVANDRLTKREFFESLPHMLRGGVIGLALGVIPGLGATPAAFVSYEQAKRRSKKAHLFGKGSLEGIAASESGNNGVNGATLAPLLTLGIPGDVVTAIMLGALLVFNLQPGPMFFALHADLVYGLFVALLVCDIALRLVGLVFIRIGRYVTRVPTGYVFPMIFVLCVLGAYASNNHLFDIATMLIFGVVGVIFARVGLPVVPFVIAFILGPMLEKGLRRSLAASGGDISVLFSSPISLIFYALTLIAIVSIVRSRWQAVRRDRSSESTPSSTVKDALDE